MSNGIGRTVKGTVRNLRSHTLKSFKRRIVVKDCPPSARTTYGRLTSTYRRGRSAYEFRLAALDLSETVIFPANEFQKDSCKGQTFDRQT
jgi:hypothetical protein